MPRLQYVVWLYNVEAEKYNENDKEPRLDTTVSAKHKKKTEVWLKGILMVGIAVVAYGKGGSEMIKSPRHSV